jgi:hypothetical protein
VYYLLEKKKRDENVQPSTATMGMLGHAALVG